MTSMHTGDWAGTGEGADEAVVAVETRAPRRGGAYIEGTVQHVSVHTETQQRALGLVPGAPERSVQVLSLRIAVPGDDPVPVVMRSHSVLPPVAGERVGVRGEWRDGWLHAAQIRALATGAVTRRRRFRTGHVVVVVMLLFVVAIAAGGLFVLGRANDAISNLSPGGISAPDPGNSRPGAKKVTVPDLRGVDVVEAAGRLWDADLLESTSMVYHASVPFGEVIRTKPPAGRRVRSGATVKLFVSSGPRLGP